MELLSTHHTLALKKERFLEYCAERQLSVSATGCIHRIGLVDDRPLIDWNAELLSVSSSELLPKRLTPEDFEPTTISTSSTRNLAFLAITVTVTCYRSSWPRGRDRR
jgi:hypothetical protein